MRKSKQITILKSRIADLVSELSKQEDKNIELCKEIAGLEIDNAEIEAQLKAQEWVDIKDRLPVTTVTVTSFIVCDEINIWCDAWVYSHKNTETGNFRYQWQDGRRITHWKPITLPTDQQRSKTNE